MNGGFGRLDGEVVHHFDSSRKHARGDDAADGGAGFIGGRESCEEGPDAFGTLDDAKNDFCRDAQRALGADEDAG